MRGTWVGTYAGVSARLVVAGQQGTGFTGRLSVAKNPRDEPTEIVVEGTVTPESVELREISIAKAGKMKDWNLGRGTGSLKSGGQQMAGTGQDRKKTYQWSLDRQSATTVSGTSLLGVWAGTYAGSPARLNLTENRGAAFAGTLRVTTQAGKAATELSVEIVLTGQSVELRETKLLAKGAVGSWMLGSGSGALQGGGNQLVGSGHDSKNPFDWSLTRQ